MSPPCFIPLRHILFTLSRLIILSLFYPVVWLMSHSRPWPWLTLTAPPHCPRAVTSLELTSRGQWYLSQRAISSHSAVHQEWAGPYRNRPLCSNTLLFWTLWDFYSRLPLNRMCTHEGLWGTYVQRRHTHARSVLNKRETLSLNIHFRLRTLKSAWWFKMGLGFSNYGQNDSLSTQVKAPI